MYLAEFRSFARKRGRQPELVLPFGDYTSIYLSNPLGLYNPFHTETYDLSFERHLRLFFKYHISGLFTRYNVFIRFFWGSIKAFTKSVQVGRKLLRDFSLRGSFRRPADSRLDEAQLNHIRRLYPKPIFFDWGLIVRTLWLDRLMMAIVLGLNTALFALGIPFGLAGLIPTLFALRKYRKNASRFADFDPSAADSPIQKIGNEISKTAGVPFVVMGHTHNPRSAELESEGRVYDIGTWAPYYYDVECKMPSYDKRRFLVLSKDSGGCHAEFVSWLDFKDGAINEEPVQLRRH